MQEHTANGCVLRALMDLTVLALACVPTAANAIMWMANAIAFPDSRGKCVKASVQITFTETIAPNRVTACTPSPAIQKPEAVSAKRDGRMRDVPAPVLTTTMATTAVTSASVITSFFSIATSNWGVFAHSESKIMPQVSFSRT